MKERPTQQEDVEDVILHALEGSGVQTTFEITRSVRDRLPLTAGDLVRANERPNEAKVDQIIANALQAGRRLCRDGLIERTGRGEFRITEKGRDYLTEQRKDIALMSETLGAILGPGILG